MTTNATRRRAKRDLAKAAKGSRNVAPRQVHGHIGVCSKCDRLGLIDPEEGVCTGTKALEGPPYWQERSVRCNIIFTERNGIYAEPLTPS